MKPILYHYPKCSTCQKAVKWLADHGVEADLRSIVDETPTAADIRAAWTKSGLPLRRFFNTSGMKYRELALSSRLPDLPEAEQLDLLASDGMLIKRPFVVAENGVLLGFKADQWAAFFGVGA